MTHVNLRSRIESLESRVSQLQDELQSVQSRQTKDWRRTIGAFTNDEGLKEILREAMRLREADRKKASSKRTTKRGTTR